MPEFIQSLLTLGNALKIPETSFEINGRDIYYDHHLRCYWLTASDYLAHPPSRFDTIEEALSDVLAPLFATALQCRGVANGTQ